MLNDLYSKIPSMIFESILNTVIELKWYIIGTIAFILIIKAIKKIISFFKTVERL